MRVQWLDLYSPETHIPDITTHNQRACVCWVCSDVRTLCERTIYREGSTNPGFSTRYIHKCIKSSWVARTFAGFITSLRNNILWASISLSLSLSLSRMFVNRENTGDPNNSNRFMCTLKICTMHPYSILAAHTRYSTVAPRWFVCSNATLLCSLSCDSCERGSFFCCYYNHSCTLRLGFATLCLVSCTFSWSW